MLGCPAENPSIGPPFLPGGHVDSEDRRVTTVITYEDPPIGGADCVEPKVAHVDKFLGSDDVVPLATILAWLRYGWVDRIELSGYEAGGVSGQDGDVANGTARLWARCDHQIEKAVDVFHVYVVPAVRRILVARLKVPTGFAVFLSAEYALAREEPV